MPTHDTTHIPEGSQKFQKDFDAWNEAKKEIEVKDITSIVCKRGQFWLCKIGENIGSEISKPHPYIRPVLVINTRFRGGLVLVVPMTTKPKEQAMKYYHHIDGLAMDSIETHTVCSTRSVSGVANDSFEDGMILSLHKSDIYLSMMAKNLPISSRG